MEEYIDDPITLITAKLAKDKGFKIRTKKFYCDNKQGVLDCDKYYSFNEDNDFLKHPSLYGNTYSASTQTALQKWLREKHNIHISVILDQTIHMKYWYKIIECKKWDESIYVEIKPENSWLHLRYEEALEEALQEALKYIS